MKILTDNDHERMLRILDKKDMKDTIYARDDLIEVMLKFKTVTSDEIECLDCNCLDSCPFPAVPKILTSEGCEKRKKIINKLR